jgi:hypothetical protein
VAFGHLPTVALPALSLSCGFDPLVQAGSMVPSVEPRETSLSNSPRLHGDTSLNLLKDGHAASRPRWLTHIYLGRVFVFGGRSLATTRRPQSCSEHAHGKSEESRIEHPVYHPDRARNGHKMPGY